MLQKELEEFRQMKAESDNVIDTLRRDLNAAQAMLDHRDNENDTSFCDKFCSAFRQVKK